MGTSIRIVPHNSPAYLQAVELRRRLLRQPLGMDFSAGELAAEDSERILVAEEGETVIGCLHLHPVSPSVIKMRQVCVSEATQGRGIGSELVREAEKEAAAEGFSEMRLHARKHIVPFYERLDYAVRGHEFTEVGLPHFLMQKVLSR